MAAEGSTPFDMSSESDLLDEIGAIGRNLSALGLAFRAARRPGQRHEGADQSGAVRIVIDDRLLVQRIEIAPSFSPQAHADQIGTILMAAYANAVERFATATGDAIEEALKHRPDSTAAWLGQAAPPPRPERRDRDVRDHVTSPAVQQETLAALRCRLDRIESEFDRVDRLVERAAAAPQRPGQTVTGPAGALTATVEGGQIVGIEADPGRVRPMNARELGREAFGVFKAAARLAPR